MVVPMLTVSRRLRWFAIACLLLVLVYILCHLHHYPTRIFSKATAEDLNELRSIYIASVQWNSEAILETHWIPSLLQLVKELQAVNINVYVSIYESGSQDDTRNALSRLAESLKELNVNSTISLDSETHAEVIEKAKSTSTGWLRTLYGKELRRIHHLSNVRNRALQPLDSLNRAGIKFDKLLYLNDVVFSAQDALTLLDTRKGNYAAACGLDYLNPPWGHLNPDERGWKHPPGLYDDFAIRDSNGNALGSHLYPYFSSSTSKAAILSSDVVPVQSCWNGMVAFDAAPFQSSSNPLRFRSIPDSLAQYHVEASECCLIHYDNPLSTSAGVWINPAVRVGYSSTSYVAVSSGEWPTQHELRWGKWKSRWTWWMRDPGPWLKVSLRLRRWRRQVPDAREPGVACVEDLAMVLTDDGWRYRGGNFE